MMHIPFNRNNILYLIKFAIIALIEMFYFISQLQSFFITLKIFFYHPEFGV